MTQQAEARLERARRELAAVRLLADAKAAFADAVAFVDAVAEWLGSRDA